MTAPILTLESVSVDLGGRRVVDRVDLALPPGSVTVLVGPNGAGKSSLLGIAGGDRRPSGGQVTLDGRPLVRWTAAELAAKRAVMTQSGAPAFGFAVHEAVRLGLDGIGRGLRPADRLAILERVLAVTELTALAGRSCTALSGGEQQRVRFARALAQLAAGRSMGERQLLLLDEPIASLDPRHQFALMDEARAFARSGNAVLAVLHDLRIAEAYADRLAVLRHGRLTADLDRSADTLGIDLLADTYGISVAQARMLVGDPAPPARTAP